MQHCQEPDTCHHAKVMQNLDTGQMQVGGTNTVRVEHAVFTMALLSICNPLPLHPTLLLHTPSRRHYLLTVFFPCFLPGSVAIPSLHFSLPAELRRRIIQQKSYAFLKHGT